ncbi:MAG: hypothetical protein AB1896_23335, partial [Thermodesulfobacteriota bacterium]
RQPDVFLVRGMPIALSRLGYALKRTIQYLCEALAQQTKSPRRYTEALLVMGMNYSFGESIQVAYNQLYRTEAMVEVGYWNTVADFEVLAASYKMIAGLSNPKNKTKAELFAKIDALQHQVTVTGEKIVTAAKGVKPDFEAARKLKGLSVEAAPLFQKLVAASIRTE